MNYEDQQARLLNAAATVDPARVAAAAHGAIRLAIQAVVADGSLDEAESGWLADLTAAMDRADVERIEERLDEIEALGETGRWDWEGSTLPPVLEAVEAYADLLEIQRGPQATAGLLRVAECAWGILDYYEAEDPVGGVIAAFAP